MRTRHLSAIALLPIVAGCAGVPRVLVTDGHDGRTVTVWRFEGEAVVGATSYRWESPNTEHPDRHVIRVETATVAPPSK